MFPAISSNAQSSDIIFEGLIMTKGNVLRALLEEFRFY